MRLYTCSGHRCSICFLECRFHSLLKNSIPNVVVVVWLDLCTKELKYTVICRYQSIFSSLLIKKVTKFLLSSDYRFLQAWHDFVSVLLRTVMGWGSRAGDADPKPLANKLMNSGLIADLTFENPRIVLLGRCELFLSNKYSWRSLSGPSVYGITSNLMGHSRVFCTGCWSRSYNHGSSMVIMMDMIHEAGTWRGCICRELTSHDKFTAFLSSREFVRSLRLYRHVSRLSASDSFTTISLYKYAHCKSHFFCRAM